MDSLFRWIESTALSGWISQNESVFAFPAILVVHTVGMGLLVGVNAAIALRILGAASSIPLSRLEQFLPVFWVGLALNVASGVLLLVGYPTKALTNPVFYCKLACIAGAIWLTLIIRRQVLADRTVDQRDTTASERRYAAISLALWVLAIVFGRLLEYTYTRLFVDDLA